MFQAQKSNILESVSGTNEFENEEDTLSKTYLQNENTIEEENFENDLVVQDVMRR